MVRHTSHSSENHAGRPAQISPQPAAVDVGRLNQAEREVLFLLAEGHTAKSIAALTGRSAAAVNERLREARRKTGASSSRELARLLRAQKVCDEELRVAFPAAPGSSTMVKGAVDSPTGTRRIGTIIMVVFVIAAAAALLVQQTPEASPSAPSKASATKLQAASSAEADDPLLGGIPRDAEHHPSLLYGQVRSEPRDPTWAGRAETELRVHYDPLSSSGRVEDLRILCASTICEVAGAIASESTDEVNVTARQIQDVKLHQIMAGKGLKFRSGVFGSRPDSKQSVFATYWSRSAS